MINTALKEVKSMKKIKCLGVFKTNTTMYLDYEDNYWSCDKPEGRYKEDYTLLRKGTVLKAYELEEPETIDFDIYNIKLVSNRNGYALFRNMEEIYRCIWLSEMKEVKDDEYRNRN